SSRQSASSVVKRIARALLVLRIERLASVMPTFSARSVSEIRRSSMTRSRLSLMAMRSSDRQIVFRLERKSLAEHFRQSKHQETREEDRTAALAARERGTIHCGQMKLISLDSERGVTRDITILPLPDPPPRDRLQDQDCQQ